MTILWLPALIVDELVKPRVSCSVRRWSTGFPVGMYAACSFKVGKLTSTEGISEFARIWVWVSLAVWLVVSVAKLGRAPQLARTPAAVGAAN